MIRCRVVTSPVNIAPAKGKLGVLLVGLGAVATTTIAGVMAIRKGLALPIGSLTQMGTIRLGKRTEGRSPKIKDFVPLADLNDIVFGGWDIFEEDCYAAARTAGVLETSQLDAIRGELEAIQSRHLDIGNDDVEAPFPLIENIESLLAISRQHDFVSALFQNGLHRFAEKHRVFHQKNSLVCLRLDRKTPQAFNCRRG